MGYAGGTTPDPTYRTIGDHTETVQIDYDPDRLTYDDLLAVFWSSHRPTAPAFSRQYASLIFVHDEAQRAAAEDSLQRAAERFGRVATEVVPLVRFYLAEDYHQKYYLRQHRTLADEFQAMFDGDQAALRDSTAAARVNGYLAGHGAPAELEAEIARFGLSQRAEQELRAVVGFTRRAVCR